jgi:hypothetical protein
VMRRPGTPYQCRYSQRELGAPGPMIQPAGGGIGPTRRSGTGSDA